MTTTSRYILLVGFALTQSLSLLAQKEKEPAAYTYAQYVKDSLAIVKPKLIRPQFRFDNRTFFYKGQTLPINGLDAGVLLNEKLRVTFGYYSLTNYLDADKKTIGDIEMKRLLRLKYGSLNTEFIYKDTRFFSLGMPLDLGFGYNELEYQDVETSGRQELRSGFIFITDFGLSATFKPMRWFGLKGIVGYRKSVFNLVNDFHFDGLFTSIGLNIDVREIVKDVKLFKLAKRYKKEHLTERAVELITD